MMVHVFSNNMELPCYVWHKMHKHTEMRNGVNGRMGFAYMALDRIEVCVALVRKLHKGWDRVEKVFENCGQALAHAHKPQQLILANRLERSTLAVVSFWALIALPMEPICPENAQTHLSIKYPWKLQGRCDSLLCLCQLLTYEPNHKTSMWVIMHAALDSSIGFKDTIF